MNENKDKKEKKSLNESQIKDEIIRYSRESLKMEHERERTIISQSSSNLTTVSILIVALLTVIFELLDRLPKISILVIIFGIILSSFLFTSIFFSIKVQWFYKKAYKKTGSDLLEHINNYREEYSTKEAFQDQMFNDIKNIHNSIAANNDKRIKNMVVSSVLIYVFLFLLLAFGITILIVL